MQKKRKAFTLLECIITLSITMVVIGIVYTVFFSNSKTLATTEFNIDLQNESQNIQNHLLKYGAEASGIYSINGMEVNLESMNYQEFLDENGKVDINEITFNVQDDKYSFYFDSSNGVLSTRKNIESTVELSQNVKKFKIRPLDYRMKPNGTLYEANGLEISYILEFKKGYSKVTIPASVIVKFRNKNNN